MKRVFFLFTILIFIVHLAFTQTLREKFRERKEQQQKNKSGDLVPSPPDYSNLYYWAAHPGKWDYSDSIPSFLKNEVRDTSVDVFSSSPDYLYQQLSDSNMNGDVNDSILNHLTDVRTILYQASVFNGSCRVFAPRYRQAHLKAYFQMNSDQSKKAFDLAYEDLKSAFKYYLDHWNQGRPIIISCTQPGFHACCSFVTGVFRRQASAKTIGLRIYCRLADQKR